VTSTVSPSGDRGVTICKAADPAASAVANTTQKNILHSVRYIITLFFINYSEMELRNVIRQKYRIPIPN